MGSPQTILLELEILYKQISARAKLPEQRTGKQVKFRWSVILGRTTNTLNRSGFKLQHPFRKGVGVYWPERKRKCSEIEEELWTIALRYLKRIDENFAKSEDFAIQFSCLEESSYVDWHMVFFSIPTNIADS